MRSHLSGMGSLVFTCVPCDTYLFDLSVTSPGLTVSHHAVVPTSPGLTVSHYADRLTYQSHLQAWLFHIMLTVWIKMMADGWKNRFSD